jgi:hypothetical protein
MTVLSVPELTPFLDSIHRDVQIAVMDRLSIAIGDPLKARTFERGILKPLLALLDSHDGQVHSTAAKTIRRVTLHLPQMRQQLELMAGVDLERLLAPHKA